VGRFLLVSGSLHGGANARISVGEGHGQRTQGEVVLGVGVLAEP